jgi:hypothetical protein
MVIIKQVSPLFSGERQPGSAPCALGGFQTWFVERPRQSTGYRWRPPTQIASRTEVLEHRTTNRTHSRRP